MLFQYSNPIPMNLLISELCTYITLPQSVTLDYILYVQGGCCTHSAETFVGACVRPVPSNSNAYGRRNSVFACSH